MSNVFCEYKGFSRAAQRTIFLNTYEIISQIFFVWVSAWSQVEVSIYQCGIGLWDYGMVCCVNLSRYACVASDIAKVDGYASKKAVNMKGHCAYDCVFGPALCIKLSLFGSILIWQYILSHSMYHARSLILIIHVIKNIPYIDWHHTTPNNLTRSHPKSNTVTPCHPWST